MEISIFTTFFESNLYLFLFVVTFLSQLGIPLGAIFFILFASSMMNSISELLFLFLIALSGVVIGDLLSYIFGKKIFGFNFFQNLLKKENINKMYIKTEKIFIEKGAISIFISRFLITGVGPMLNYIAGLQGFNFKKFTLYMVLGEILYVSEFLILGYIFKNTIDDLFGIISNFGLMILLIVFLYIIGINLFKKKNKTI